MSKPLKEKIQELLGVRCVFPNSVDSSSVHCTARCMLEYGSNSKTLRYEDSVEDIVARVRVLENDESLRRTEVSSFMYTLHLCEQEIKFLVSKLFSKVDYFRFDGVSSGMLLESKKFSVAVHPGILNLMKLIESKNEIVVVQNFAKHSILSVSRFHSETTLSSATLGNISGLGSKDLRLRFIIYQLLQVVSFIHSLGLCLDNIVPRNILLDDDMWVFMPLGLTDRVFQLAGLAMGRDHPNQLEASQFVDIEGDHRICSIPRPIDYHEPLTIQWLSGKLSNFEYLMAVNHGAGRTMMDPLYHPILPWVTDFSVNQLQYNSDPTDGYRDLTKTKFRLSKGDAQLETTFRHSDPPHHVPESLSELTYYIYMARRTPMQVLRRVVRDVFVPEHYPHSVARIYDWTPDECIPEFYFDTSVFHSIHTSNGLHDLELPTFAPTPEEFIAYHREVLESDEVSCMLHHWIDLTFGYCLQGQAAIDNMNVPLRHTLSSSERVGVDSPNVNKNPGFVMLFDRPHPMKQVANRKARSHIFSFNNSKESTQSFLDLNQLYLLNNSSKFSNSADDEQHRDGFDIQALINLDSPAQQVALASLFQNSSNAAAASAALSNAKTELKSENKEFTGGSATAGGGAVKRDSTTSVAGTVGAGYDETKSTFHNAKRSVVSRKASLQKPNADPSLTKLKHAGFIGMRNDNRCGTSISNLENQKREYLFAADFGTGLDAVYSLPTNSEVQSAASNLKPISDVPFTWDEEFEVNLKAVQACLTERYDAMREARTVPSSMTDAHKKTIKIEQANDMLAVGCIIAELYNGRPLMNSNDAKLLANDKEEGIKFVFRNTTGLPLSWRRLVTLLLQKDYWTRPKAVEILQACILADQELWSSKEVSKQRSGGCEAGYVNFQPAAQPARQGYQPSKQGEEPTDQTAIARLQQAFMSSIESSEEDMAAESQLHQNPRVELLSDFCTALFPSYFKVVYRIVGELKLCKDGLRRICILVNSLDEILNIPLDGLNLALCHILEIIGNPEPFHQAAEEVGTNTPGTSRPSSSQKENRRISYCTQVILEYPRIIDVLGQRLGYDGTEKLLVPKIMEFLNNLMSPELLQCLLHSNLWNVIILRGGVRCFLRYYLQLLMTYISSGTLYNVSKTVDRSNSDAVPLWATVDIEKNEWLQSCSLSALRQVQRASVFAIASLIEPEGLGPGLCSRYILPALLSLVGIPQLASAGFGSADPEGYTLEDVNRIFRGYAVALEVAKRNKEKPGAADAATAESKELVVGVTAEEREMLESYVSMKSSYDSQFMYVSQAIVNLCIQLGELVVSELVLSKIFNSTLPDIEPSVHPLPRSNTIAALMEIIQLLNGLLPSLSPETVQKDYLQPSKTSGMCLPKLLTLLPLAPSWALADDFTEDHMKYADLESYIESQKRHALHLELCRLIVSSSMIAGSDACTEHVLPSVDIFFRNFVVAFGLVPIESRTMARAFELGAELFLPLAQLTGPEAFYTAVPNLNPRLEMWLVSVGSNIPAKSPPLPGNIWPEVTTETLNQPEKKKGFMQWISSGKAKIFSHLSSSSTASYGTQSTATASSAASALNHKHGNSSSFFSQSSSSHSHGSKHYSLNNEERHHRSDHNDHGSRARQDRAASEHIPSTPAIDSASDLLPPSMGLHATPAALPAPPSSVMKRTPFTKQPDIKSPTEGTELMEIDPNSPVPPSLPLRPSVISAVKSTMQANGNLSGSPCSHMNLLGNDLPTSSSATNSSALDDKAGIADTTRALTTDTSDSKPVNEEETVEGTEQATDQLVDSGSDSDEDDEYAYFPQDVALLDAAAADSNSPMSPNANGDSAAEPLQVADPGRSPSLADEDPYVPLPFKSSSTPFKSYKRLVASRKANRTSLSNIHNAKVSRPTPRKSSKVGSILSGMHAENENPEELERKELYYNDMAWLLAGNGRWNVDRELKDKTAKDQRRPGKQSDWNPAAQLSLTAPRIAVDVASDAGSLFALGMQSNTQWKLEENPGLIRCMVVNPVESLLMTCSRTGVRLWSLSSHPLLHVSSYLNHSAPPYQAGFMRSGIHASTCDGNVHVWDIETRKTLAFLNYSSERGPFSSMSIVAPRHGIVPSVGAFGDDQLLTTSGNSICFYDVRCNCSKTLNNVAEWVIPPLPVPQSNFITTATEPLQLTCVSSHEQYVFTGSSNGGIWAVDRRMGKVLHSWQAHDGPVVKLQHLSERHVLSVSDRSAAVWEYVLEDQPGQLSMSREMDNGGREIPSWGVGEVKKALVIKNMPDSGVLAGSLMVNSFDSANSGSGMSMSSLRGQDKGIGIPSKPQHVLYCIAGHKMYAGRLPSYDISARDNINVGVSSAAREGEFDELKLSQTYFADRKGTKLSKSKLQVTSAVLLPLRRLLLIGTEDGLNQMTSRRGSQQKDSMGQFISPDNGFRGKLIKNGIQPKNHMKENFRELKATENRMRELKEESLRPQKELYKLSQFRDVSSKVFDSRQQGETHGNFLTRGESEKRRDELARESKEMRLELDRKLDEARYYSDKPPTPRKAAVPKAVDVGELHHNQVDFVQKNKVKAITSMPNRPTDRGESNGGKHESYGRVPEYLQERKEKWREEEEEIRRNMPDPSCPPGMCLMPEEERISTLEVLSQSRTEAMNQLRKMPFIIETPSQRKRQEYLEGKLREIENAISIFNKPKVYVAIDK